MTKLQGACCILASA